MIAVESRLGRDPVIFRTEAVANNRAKRLGGRLGQRGAGSLCVAPKYDPAVTRHEIHQALESELVDVKVGVNIGVIVFRRRDDEGVGGGMEKFGPSIPEGGFVLVPLEDHFAAGAEAVALAKIFRDATDQKGRLFVR